MSKSSVDLEIEFEDDKDDIPEDDFQGQQLVSIDEDENLPALSNPALHRYRNNFV